MHAPTFDLRAFARSDYMNLTLWTLQGWLSLFFIGAAYAKLTLAPSDLGEMLGWTSLVSDNLVRGVGVAELALALGILAPLVAGRAGRPVVLGAAVALLALEAVMLGVHLVGGDAGLAVVNMLLLAITWPVVWFRRS